MRKVFQVFLTCQSQHINSNLKPRLTSKLPALDFFIFFVCIYKTVTFTSTCSFHSLCLMQFPPTEVLKGVDRFLSFHRSINHDPESWWRCNCGHGFHHQVVLPAILSLSNIRQNSTRSCEKPGRVVSPSYCDGVWWNSSVFLILASISHDGVEMMETLVTLVSWRQQPVSLAWQLYNTLSQITRNEGTISYMYIAAVRVAIVKYLWKYIYLL